MKDSKQESYYDILQVDPSATVSEIITAYHAAKNAFSKDSVATYTLFNPDESQEFLKKIEEAYMTLSNVEKRRTYDSQFSNQSFNRPLSIVTSVPQPPVSAKPNITETPVFTPPPIALVPPALEETSTTTPSPATATPATFDGPALKQIRESRSLSVEDVARITKIPTRYIKAIEAQDIPNMPARVYLQGFIKNMASVYKLPPQTTAKAYTQNLDEITASYPTKKVG